MKKVLIYTDCFYFAGCENLIPVLLKNRELNSHFNLLFSYRYSVKYEDGLKKKIKINKHNIFQIRLFGFSEGNSLIDKIVMKLSFVFELVLMIYDIIVLVTHFKEIEPEVIFINNGGYPGARTCRSAAIAARLAKVKYIYFYVNNIAVPYNNIKRFMQYPIDLIIKRYVTKFVTASKYARIKLIETLKLKREDVLCILNTFEKPSIKISRQKIRNQFVKEQNALLIGCVGELSHNKGQNHLLAAVPRLKEQYGCRRFKVILIGEGPERDNYSNYIIEHSIGDCIEIIPYQWNIFDYYNAMDIYVHPSIAYDDLPFTIREAMSMGLPIIGSDFGGIPELIGDGINGKLVPPGDSVFLAKTISYLIEHEDVRKVYGKQSLAIYDQRLSPQTVMQGYHKIFNGELL